MGRRIVLFPYKMASASSKSIAEALQRETHDFKILRVFPDRKFSPRPDDVIVNWGNTQMPTWGSGVTFLNPPSAVSIAVNKLRTFERLEEAEVRTVPWTTDIDEAREWELICERHKLEAHSGAGIRVSAPNSAQNAPLYTQMLLPCEEYRVHVFQGQVIDYAKKMKLVDGEYVNEPNEHIKNHDNGFYFLRDVAPRSGVCTRAIEAVEALGLDFGAVDVLRYKNKSYVLEVGTAAGLSPMGADAYAQAILDYAGRS